MLLSKVRLQEKATVIIVRTKQSLHAFLFICRLELADDERRREYRSFGLIAKREHRAKPTVLSPQRKQEIALVFARSRPRLRNVRAPSELSPAPTKWPVARYWSAEFGRRAQ